MSAPYFYYTVDFWYPGVSVNMPGDYPASRQADKDHDAAYQDAVDAITTLGWEYKHCYSWPDGSLYLFLRCTEGASEQVEALIQEQAKIVKVQTATAHPSDYRTHQGGKIIADLWM